MTATFDSLFGTTTCGDPITPREYQTKVGAALRSGRNVVLSAPTGAGKTLAVLAPFLAFRQEMRVRRLIYCLPMRALALGIYAEAQTVALRACWPVKVTLQTGDHQGDPFFVEGDIIVCTYDQLLSGLLSEPYALSKSQHNINTAAVAGNLVVFDEFHLMEVGAAFLTAATCLGWFGDTCQSVWMTATATAPLKSFLKRKLPAEIIDLSSAEMSALQPDRALVKFDGELNLDEVVRYRDQRVLVVVNTVRKAQKLFEALQTTLRSGSIFPMENLVHLHARFFSSDKEAKRRRLYELFGKGVHSAPAIAVATQVVEAGLDISAEILLTELAPMNALLQRAGRCARFGGRGVVHVFRTQQALPYTLAELNRTWERLENRDPLTTEVGLDWVNAVHQSDDEIALRSHQTHAKKCADAIQDRVRRKSSGGVSELIRSSSPSINVFIVSDPSRIKPSAMEAISMRQDPVVKLARANPGMAYEYAPDDRELLWKQTDDLSATYLATLPPALAAYSFDYGLVLGTAGTETSPKRAVGNERTRYEYEAEDWDLHAVRVGCQIARAIDIGRRALDGPDLESFSETANVAALLHDLGKLQVAWQKWAHEYEGARDPAFRRRSLAHTTSKTAADWALEKSLRIQGVIRPPHSLASAYYAAQLLNEDEQDREVILAAIVAHHGGWFTEREIGPLISDAKADLESIGFHSPQMRAWTSTRIKDLQSDLECAILETFPDNWPQYSLLVRLLRLADQNATREANDIE